jgi:phosphoglycolate phosphatase
VQTADGSTVVLDSAQASTVVASPGRTSAVIFDIDGTLLDSATGIVAGFAAAIRAVGLQPPPDSVLRSDLGPPVGLFLASLGVPEQLLPKAVAAYRSFYLRYGMQQASLYPGVDDLLHRLRRLGLPLGTATAKRTDTALAILVEHRLDQHFTVVNGTQGDQLSKRETIARTLELLGCTDPATVIMVGDRHSDISGARACGVRAVAVSWGYGSSAELELAQPDHLIHHPAGLLDLLHS